MTTNYVLLFCLKQNYHLDKSNAAIHCSTVRFSPITFRLYELLMSEWPEGEDITQEMAEIREHYGTYEEDRGR